MKTFKQPFRPKAKLLLELGNQLIKDEGIALFELVKNGYDADATEIAVSMEKIDSPDEGKITITDNGSGMDSDTVRGAWLEPGTDHRQKQIQGKRRTKKFKRLPLGEKGIGRFGAHKLGRHIELVTRSKGKDEVVVSLDWGEFEKDTYLDSVQVNVVERKPIVFTGNATGTRLVITKLWTGWNRGMVRDTYRSLNSICSPFNKPDSFIASLTITDEDKRDWLENLGTWEDMIKHKLYRAVCMMNGSKLSYKYEFLPWTGLDKVTKRSRSVEMKMSEKDPTTKETGLIDLSEYKIGKVKFELDIFDLDPGTLSSMSGDKSNLKEFLRVNGGIRVYRDKIRVYDYGEQGNDWLELGTRRVNSPGDKVSNNIILGEVNLSRDKSSDLVEKTNREGFIENDAVKTLRRAVVFAIAQIESEREKDKKKLRDAYTKIKDKQRDPVIDDLADLRKKLQKKKLLKEFAPAIDKIENNFVDIKEKLLTSAGAGLSLSIVIHEIQKVISELRAIVNKEFKDGRVKQLVLHLSELTEGYAMLVRREGKQNAKASELIKQALFNVDYRLRVHKIKVVGNLGSQEDFTIKCSRRLIVGALMNMIDNSIWWLENKKPETKYLMLSTSKDLKGGPAIVVGDNGSGFSDELEYLRQPFFTRKPDGMGLGLHIIDEVMKVHKGKMVIPAKGDVRVPKEINGALLALVFGV